MPRFELGRVDVTLYKAASATDTSRVPASGHIVEVYREGAWAQGAGSETGAGATISVHDPGSIVAGDLVAVGVGVTTAFRIVSSVTAASIVVSAGGAGAFSWSDGSRIIPINTRPLTYTDDAGIETTPVAFQVTTDSSGEASFYTRLRHVDLVTNDGAGNRTVIPDQVATGGRSTLSPFDWGARADGTTDDAGALSDALEYLKAVGGGVIELPPGTTRLGSTVTLNAIADCKIVGAGRGVTVVEINHTGVGFDLTGACTDVTIEGFTVKRLAGTADQIQIGSASSRITTRDLVFRDGGIGIDVHGTDCRGQDLWFLGTGWTTFVRLDAAVRPHYHGIVASPAGAWTRGIDIDTGCTNVRVTNLDIEPTIAVSGIGVHVRDSAAGADPLDVIITEPHLECGSTGNCIQVDAVVGLKLNGGALLNSSRGVVIGGGRSIKLIGTNIVGMQNEAVDINAGSHIRMVELDLSDNNAAAGSVDDINLAAGIDDVSIVGFTAGDYWNQSGAFGNRGLGIAAGVSDRVQVLAGRIDDTATTLMGSSSTSQLGDFSHLMSFGAGSVVHTAAPAQSHSPVGAKTLTGAETTTDVSNLHTLTLNQSGNTVWTNLTNGVAHQRVSIVNIHATSTATFNDGGNFALGDVSRVLSQTDVLVLQWVGNLSLWVEVGFYNN